MIASQAYWQRGWSQRLVNKLGGGTTYLASQPVNLGPCPSCCPIGYIECPICNVDTDIHDPQLFAYIWWTSLPGYCDCINTLVPYVLTKDYSQKGYWKKILTNSDCSLIPQGTLLLIQFFCSVIFGNPPVNSFYFAISYFNPAPGGLNNIIRVFDPHLVPYVCESTEFPFFSWSIPSTSPNWISGASSIHPTCEGNFPNVEIRNYI
jgi:hypothetical protein